MFKLLAIGVFWIFLLAPAHGQDSDASDVERYRQACESGFGPGGCTQLGMMYQAGDGVVQDHARAAEYFRQACEGDQADGCGNLGVMYQFGNGVVQDYVIAHALFNLAASRGYQFPAGLRSTVEGLMTPQQIAEAHALARRCQEVGIEECL